MRFMSLMIIGLCLMSTGCKTAVGVHLSDLSVHPNPASNGLGLDWNARVMSEAKAVPGICPEIRINNAPGNWFFVDMSEILSRPVVLAEHNGKWSGAVVSPLNSPPQSIGVPDILLPNERGPRGEITKCGRTAFEFAAGPFLLFVPPSSLIAGAQDSGAREFGVSVHYDPFSDEKLVLGSDRRLSATARAWDLRSVLQRELTNNAVTIVVLDARSLTPITNAEVVLRDDGLEGMRSMFVDKSFFDAIVAPNLEVFGLPRPSEGPILTNNRGVATYYPSFVSTPDSVSVLVRHPNHEPLHGHLSVAGRSSEWEVTLPRIGTRIEVGEAPELRAKIRNTGGGGR